MAQPRFYIRIAKNIYSDPKLKGLTDAEKWAWIALLSLADDSKVPGTLPEPVEDMAYRLRTDEAALRGCIEKLLAVDRPPLAYVDGVLTVVNWEDHQGRKKYPSDDPDRVKERVGKHRAGKKARQSSNGEDNDSDDETAVTSETSVTAITGTHNITEHNRTEKGSSNKLPPTSTPDPVDDEQELPALKPLTQFKAFRLTAPHYRITEQLFGWDRAETKRNTAAWQAHLNDNPDKAIADFNANWQGFMDRRFRFDRQDAAKASSNGNGNGAAPVPSLPDPDVLLRRQMEADERRRQEQARIARGER